MRKVTRNKHRHQTPIDLILHQQDEVAGRLDRKLKRLNVDLDSVHKTSRLLTGPMDLQQVLEIVVRTVAQAVGADAAGIRLLDEETDTLVLKATYGLSEAYKNKGPITAGESSLNRRALAGEAIVVEDMCKDERFKKHLKYIQQEGFISTLYIGLMYKEKGIGIFRLYSRRHRRFSEEDISLAQTVAAQSAAAIVNARLYQEALEGERMARQVRLAGEVQRHLLPKRAPELTGIDLAGEYVPCYDVGGDFYDYIKLPNGELVVTIGDVMGKGVPASLTMASLRSALRAYAEQVNSLEEIAGRVNRMFCQDSEVWEFATLFFCRIQPDSGHMTFCNCGHEPAVLLRNHDVISLAEGGMVLGVVPNGCYEQQHVQLQPGDTLILYTDGLADATNYQHEMFGRERIIDAARKSQEMSAEQTAKNILWHMRKFTGITQYTDDTALVILKKQ